MGGALHDGLLSPDDQLFANACEVARESGEFDLAPTLITVAERPDSPRSETATRLVVELVDRLVHARDATRTRADTADIRKQFAAACWRAWSAPSSGSPLTGGANWSRRMSSLAGSTSPALRAILESPHHPC